MKKEQSKSQREGEKLNAPNFNVAKGGNRGVKRRTRRPDACDMRTGSARRLERWRRRLYAIFEDGKFDSFFESRIQPTWRFIRWCDVRMRGKVTKLVGCRGEKFDLVERGYGNFKPHSVRFSLQ